MRRNSSRALAALMSLGVVGAASAEVFGLTPGSGLATDQLRSSWSGVVEAIEGHIDDAATWLGGQLTALGRLFRKNMVFRLVHQGQFHTITFDGAGTQRAAQLLAQVHPGVDASGVGNYQSSPTWALLNALLDDTFRAQYERIANLGGMGEQKFFVTIFLDEPSYPVDAGTTLNLPGGGTDTLQANEAFWQFLQRHGTDLDAMVQANPGALSVSAAAWYLRSGQRDVRLAEPRLGWAGGVQEFLATLLHEAAHVGDTTPCALGNGYGPDDLHYINEVISPQGAFGEGWADYLAAVMPGKEQRGLQQPGTLKVEGATAGQYQNVATPTLADYLASEAYVGRILQAIEREFGFPAMAVAFMQTNRTECRDMGHFLVALASGIPARREQLKAILDRETQGVASAEELEALITRGFPERPDRASGASSDSSQHAEAADGAVLAEFYEDFAAYGTAQ